MRRYSAPAMILAMLAPAGNPIQVFPEEVVWGPAPPSLPPGAQAAVLEGDPKTAGVFTLRMKIPAGYRLDAHTHVADERVTVLSGSIHVGFGDVLDTNPAKSKTFGPGSFYVNPTPQPHYVWTDAETVIQITGMGPWTLTYVDPARDPRATKK